MLTQQLRGSLPARGGDEVKVSSLRKAVNTVAGIAHGGVPGTVAADALTAAAVVALVIQPDAWSKLVALGAVAFLSMSSVRMHSMARDERVAVERMRKRKV